MSQVDCEIFHKLGGLPVKKEEINREWTRMNANGRDFWLILI